MKSVWQAGLLSCLVAGSGLAADSDVELKQFRGHWEVVELSENGHVIPREAIPEWLPSGGKLEIADNAIMFTSPGDGKKHAKLFSIDATQYPRAVDIVTRDKKEALGIYRFDDDRLVVCLTDAEEGSRPKEFSAKAGSKRMLMVLKKTSKPEANIKPESDDDTPLPTTGEGVTAKILTDAEVAKMLPGVWRHKDDAGALVVTIGGDGTWSTVRESTEMRLFQKVFVRTPISGGKWSLQNGTLTFLCTSSIHRSRLNHQLSMTIRSISDQDFIFVDSMGRLGKATKVGKP